MPENLSDPMLGELEWHPAEDNWTGRVEVRLGEAADLLISREDDDVSVADLLQFARGQLDRIREGLDRYRRRAAREVRKRHPQRNRPGLRGLSEGELAAGLGVVSIQFDDNFNTVFDLRHEGIQGEILVYLDPNGKVDEVEF